ncbi:SOS response-associated peptidase [Wenzhouxiangella sp. XN79A]|uniref:SOS response-associated peptidase n=1 Tax=Wenzhouxiangella sp. XN79A TaxID=2724193 RepID=UPI00144ACB77|nr:SOS response-associated peptidase [Wenzhouxiangella sp. XN79A]NKI33701.1 SOS response-associated peptidase [Wenzhouxiangella sp. XN79A]
MCGRVGLAFDWKTVWGFLSLPGEPPAGGEARYNVAPSTRTRDGVDWRTLPALRPGADGGRRVDALVWPLIPHWLDDELPKYATANCRTEPGRSFTETVGGKPAFRSAWRRNQRCAVPIGWFYEWDPRSQPRQPWRVAPAGAPILVLAGLWDRSTDAAGTTRESLTLLTTEPNETLRSIGHHRAPVLLGPGQLDTWLDAPPAEAEAVLRPPPDDALTAQPVTRRVNNPGYTGDDLLESDDAG